MISLFGRYRAAIDNAYQVILACTLIVGTNTTLDVKLASNE